MPTETFLLLTASVVVTSMLAGLCWTVQVVVYPQFGNVSNASFAGYHAAHTRWITRVVGPLMIGELLLSVALLVVPGVEPVVAWTLLSMTAVIWLSTAALQVPMHARLERDGLVPSVVRSLVRSNWVRTVAWSARVALLAWLLVDGTVTL